MIKEAMTSSLMVFILAVLVALVLFLTSCKTYNIPLDSFRQQFTGMAPSREVTTRGPMGDKVTYHTYPIDLIHAVDKNGSPVIIQNSPAIEIRFTDTANKRTVFYFDLLRIEGDSVTGVRSRLITSFRKTIPLASIKKIEIQNGRKNFRYVK